MAVLQPELEIAEPVVREDLFRNIDDVLVLKYARVRGTRQKPQPRHNACLIGPTKSPGWLGRKKVTDEPVEKRARPLLWLDREGHVFADQLLLIGCEVVAQQFEIELEQLRHGFMTGRPGEQKVVLTETMDPDGDQPLILCERVQRHGGFRKPVT